MNYFCVDRNCHISPMNYLKFIQNSLPLSGDICFYFSSLSQRQLQRPLTDSNFQCLRVQEVIFAVYKVRPKSKLFGKAKRFCMSMLFSVSCKKKQQKNQVNGS